MKNLTITKTLLTGLIVGLIFGLLNVLSVYTGSYAPEGDIRVIILFFMLGPLTFFTENAGYYSFAFIFPILTCSLLSFLIFALIGKKLNIIKLGLFTGLSYILILFVCAILIFKYNLW